MTTEEPGPRLDRALIPLGAVLSVIFTAGGVLMAAYGYFQHQFGSIQSSQAELIRRVDRLEERQLDRWTQTDQALWILNLSRDNPSLKVPGPMRAPTAHNEGRTRERVR